MKSPFQALLNQAASRILFGFLAWASLFLEASWAESKQLRPMKGKGNPYFTYFPITSSDGSPVVSVKGEPLFEGIRRKDGRVTRVTQTLSNLYEKRLLAISPDPEQTSPWVKNTVDLHFSAKVFEDVFTYLSKHPEDFRRAFSTMTSSKLKMFESLLFGDELKLSFDDLKTLKLTPFAPNPESVRIPLPYPQLLDFLFDWIIEIAVGELVLRFGDKQVMFRPETNDFSVSLLIDAAELRGFVHKIGRIRNAHQYSKRWPFRHWDKYTVLLGGTVKNLKIDFALQLAPDKEGFWKIQFSKPLKLLVGSDVELRWVKDDLIGPDGRGTYTNDDIEIEHAPVSQEVVTKIERILSETIASGFATSFMPEDFTMRLKVPLPEYEKVNGISEVENKLSSLQFTSRGLRFQFDSRFVALKKSECASALPDISTIDQDDAISGENDSRGKAPWVLASSRVKEAGVARAWNLSNASDEALSNRSSIHVASHGLDLILKSAALSGLYCVSTRAVCPRPGSVPLLEFRPTELPKLLLGENSMKAQVEADLLTYERTDNMSDARLKELNLPVPPPQFVIAKPRSISLELGFDYDPKAGSVFWKAPSKLKLNGTSEEENNFISKISELVGRGLLGTSNGGSGNQQVKGLAPFATKIAEMLLEVHEIKDLSIGKRGISADVVGLKLSSPRELKDSEKEAQVKSEEAIMPELIKFMGDMPAEVSSPAVNVAWEKSQNQCTFYSWRLINRTKGSVSQWTSFKDLTRTSFKLEEPGKYEFEIKSMNRSFEISKEDAVYKFFYKGFEKVPSEENPPPEIEVSDKNRRVPKGDSGLPQTDAEARADAPKQKGAKGLFGCSLHAQSDVKSSLFVFFLFFGILWIFRRRGQTR